MSFVREIDAKLFNEVEKGDLAEVQKCLNRGADVLARNDHHTVLHAAVSYFTDGEILKLVLSKIKEMHEDVTQYINAKDTEGDTPLMWAIENRNTKAAEILLEYGVDIEAKNNDGWTALHWTAEKDEWQITRLLIKKGANVYAEDKNGKKALDIARRLGYSSTVEAELYKNDYSPKEVARFTGNVALGTAAVVTAGAGILAVGGLLFIPVTIAGGVLGAAKLVVDGLKGAGTVVANASSTEYVDSRPKDFDPDYYNRQRRNIRQFQMKEFKY